MKEKQETRRIEVGIIQLVVVVFRGHGSSKIPYLKAESIVLLGVVHVVSYYISSYYENLKSIEATWMKTHYLTVKYCFVFIQLQLSASHFAVEVFVAILLYVTRFQAFSYTLQILFLNYKLCLFFVHQLSRRKVTKNILLISDHLV